jgi:hypothetical protein
MNKKNILIIVGLVLVFVLAVIFLIRGKNGVGGSSKNGIRLQVVGKQIHLLAGDRKVSMLNLTLLGVKSLKINKDVFNSELMNKNDGEGNLLVLLGVMKSTSELPSGDIVVGDIDSSGNVGLVKGIVTTVSNGSGKAEDVNLIGGKVEVKK